MSIKALNWAFDLYFKTPSHKLVMLALADNATNEGLSYPFIKTIASKACIKDIRHVQRILRTLETQGYITSEEHFKKGNKQTSNCYQLHIEKVFPTIRDLSTRVVYRPGGGWSTDQGGDGVQTTHTTNKTLNKSNTNKEMQDSENHQPKHITNNNNLKKEECVVLPNWLDKELWNEFREHRKTAIKKPMTSLAEKKMFNWLDKQKNKGYDIAEIINKSIRCGWSDLWSPEENEYNKNKTVRNNNEIRSTVKDWMPGNPDYDRVNAGRT